MEKRERRSPNLPLANPGHSNRTKKLMRDNELLKQRLRQLESGPFGIYSWFKKIKAN